jgi:structural maintenance of chromosome 3 (chondroitin sulfate proteoglycan 6)
LHANLNEKEVELANLQSEIRQTDGLSNSALNELQKHETLLKRNKDTYEQMKVDIRNKRLEIERIERSIPQKERSVQSLLNDIQQFSSKNDLLKSELGTELLKQLSPNEQKKVDELNEKIHKLNQDLKETLDKRSQIEGEKFKLESNLTNNLKKRKEQLETDLSETRLSDNLNKITLYNKELASLNGRIDDYEDKLGDLKAHLNESNRLETLKLSELDKLTDIERKLQDDMQNETVDLERLASKLSLLIKKKEECLKATRNLGEFNLKSSCLVLLYFVCMGSYGACFLSLSF